MVAYKRLESSIERSACDKIKALGGKFLKVYPFQAGEPDRLLLKWGGKLALVEMKRPGCKPTKLQLHRHTGLRKLGFKVYVCDSVECVLEIYRKL